MVNNHLSFPGTVLGFTTEGSTSLNARQTGVAVTMEIGLALPSFELLYPFVYTSVFMFKGEYLLLVHRSVSLDCEGRNYVTSISGFCG